MKPPSAWQIEKAVSLAHEYLTDRLDDAELPTDEAELLDALRADGTDIAGMMRRLLLAATEAHAFAGACAQRMEILAQRKARFQRLDEHCRQTALAIMTTLPELFPDGKFRDPAVGATVGTAKPGVVVTDESKLDDRFFVVARVPDKRKIATAINDGEVVEGATIRNGAPFIAIRT